MNWFECKVSYEKIMEKGVQKKVTEPYLVDALSHAEAEARIIKEIEPYISGEFTVSSVRRANYSDIFPSGDSDWWWRAKVSFISMDEKSGTEKRTNVSMLCQGDDIEEAIKTIHGGMKGTMADYEIIEVKRSPIMEIFVYAGN